MTVRMLVEWTNPADGRTYLPNNLLNTDAGTESGLVSAGLASSNLTGGSAWGRTSVPSGQPMAVEYFSDPITGRVEVSVGTIRVRGEELDGRKVSSESAAYYPCNPTYADIARGPIDSNGNTGAMTIGAGTTAAEVWANAGYATSKAAVGGVFTDTRTATFNRDLVLLAMTVNMPATASLTFFAGSSNYHASETGICLGVASNTPRLFVCGGGVAGANIALATPTIADGNDHSIVIAIVPEGRAVYAWVDGDFLCAVQGAYTEEAGEWTTPLNFGSHRSVTATAMAVKFSDVNVIIEEGGVLPYNMSEIVADYHANGGDIYPMIKRSLTLDVFTAGQSGQIGQGETAGRNDGLGTPLRDPILPNGQANKRSFYPSMAGELGKHGITTQVYNYGRGGSSLRDCWVGYLSAWVSGLEIKSGRYVTSGGRIWKAVLATQNLKYTSTAVPAEGTGADSITWTDIGPEGSAPLGVQPVGSALFDPLGNIAAMVAAINASTGAYKAAYIAFGETDADLEVQSSDYADALVQMCGALNATGSLDKILLGHTIGTPSSTYRDQYDAQLVPGVAAAVAALGGNVVAGINMYSAYGTLTSNPASGIGTQADGLHGNDEFYDVAGVGLARSIYRAVFG